MTKDQIQSRLTTDGKFALGFGIDNNLPGIIAALKDAGYNGGDTKEYALSILTSLLNSGKKNEVIAMLSKVQYLNSTSNYTGGLKDYFLRTSPPNSNIQGKATSKLDWAGVLAGLGAGLSTFAGISLASDVAGAAAPNNAAALTAAADAQAQADAAKAAKIKKNWIIGISIGGGLLLVIGLIIAFRKPKAAAATV